jgi:hypothetical protein
MTGASRNGRMARDKREERDSRDVRFLSLQSRFVVFHTREDRTVRAVQSC